MKIIRAEIITIGDEILYGHITDTNSQWISNELSKAGFKVLRKVSVGDNEEDIIKAVSDAENRAEIILLTGGLGPTNDDITKKTLAKYFNCSLILNQEALNDVTDFFKKRGRDLSELNKTQAYIPEACAVIRNDRGTAPGMLFEKNSKILASMPGVPFEMKSMMLQKIIPILKEKFTTPVIYHKEIKTVGIGESFLADKIKNWEESLPSHIKLAYLPSPSEVKLRLTLMGDNIEKLKSETENKILELEKIAGEYIYGFDDDTLPKVIGDLLRKKNLKISVAESCTGGLISYLITSIPGSSEYFMGSMIAYDNSIKQNILGVQEKTLKTFGAVSEETVKEMAEAVRKKFNTSIGISSSGVAGPSGGTPEKPVGTVWIALSNEKNTLAKKLNLANDRELNMRHASISVLNLLRESLIKNS